MAKEEKKAIKLPYDKLEKAAMELNAKVHYLENANNNLVKKVNELSGILMNKRMDFLFKVVENAEQFTPEFVVMCVEEIQCAIYPQQEEPKEESQEKAEE